MSLVQASPSRGPSPGPGWRVVRQRGPAAELHRSSAAMAAAPAPARTLRLLRAEAPALVLGSAQPVSDVDVEAADAAGVAVARRRSGGGAVLVESGILWADFLLPAGDRLWDADVGKASWWVGEVWSEALEHAGAGSVSVWRGPLRKSRWSGQVCFAGLGPGEVVLGGRKVMGVSQRRTREAVLFQTAVLLKWEPERTLGLLRAGRAAGRGALDELVEVAVGVGEERAAALEAALVAALPG
ncbi:MAG: lipoyl protein ligase domain-containing protein [Acidimicrobiales bacterium]